MIRFFLTAAVGFFALFTLAILAPASASFGDCMDPDYLSGFGGPDVAGDPMNPVRTITCVVEFDIEYASAVGPRRIRGIRDASADWGFFPGALAEVEVGARAAIEAMKELRGYQVEDITILILDDSYDLLSAKPDPRGEVAAVANGNIDGSECYITTFMLGRTGAPNIVAYNVAHEIFHCVQAASVTAAQWGTTATSGAWWAEGSAEYFASLALSAVGDLHNRAGAFDRAVDAKTPLYNQTYGMAVFFYWFHHHVGASSLIGFLNQMASSSGAGAQRAAMRRVLSDEEWLQFAEAYADRSITTPSGAALAFSTEDSDNIHFDFSRIDRSTLLPFLLRRGWINYDCGRWENELAPDSANFGARAESDSAWGPLPAEIDATEGAGSRYRFAALHTAEGAQNIAIDVERVQSCKLCAGSEEVDACLVGTWVMSGGGAIEWMKAQGIPIIRDNPGTRVVSFGDDGIYYTQQFSTQITVELDDGVAYGDGVAVPAVGRWSIAGGQLAVCQDSGGMSGTVTKGDVTIPLAVPAGGTLLQDYSCSATTLNTTLDMGSGSPMRTTYTKVSAPADP